MSLCSDQASLAMQRVGVVCEKSGEARVRIAKAAHSISFDDFPDVGNPLKLIRNARPEVFAARA